MARTLWDDMNSMWPHAGEIRLRIHIYEQMKVFAASAKGAQKQVCEFLLEHTQDVAFMTVDDVAQRTGVSPGSVTRTTQAMGFKGYPEVQEHIRQVIRDSIAPANRFEQSSRDPFDSSQSIQIDVENLRKVLFCNPSANIRQAAELIALAPAVYCMGMRSSYSVAYFLAFNLNMIRDHVHLIEPGANSQPDIVKNLRQEDVFLVASLPRYHHETVLMTNEAVRAGCTVIALTDSLFSPMARVARISLTAPYNSMSFFNSYVAAFGLANLLISQTAAFRKDESAAALAKLHAIHERYKIFV